MNKKPKFNAKGNTFTPKATKKAPMNKPRGTQAASHIPRPRWAVSPRKAHSPFPTNRG